jgi:hypothetical protein
MPVVAVSVIITKHPTIIGCADKVVDVGKVITGHNSAILPDFIPDCAVAALA